jgi:CheY-like chemotaxis protein
MAEVLIVDDEVEIVRIIGALLKIEGVEAFGTSDPDEAIRVAAQDDSIKLILSDVQMPNVSGPEMIRTALRQRPDEVRVMFMSGAPQRAVAFRRTDPLLNKPLSFETISGEIRKTLTEPIRTLEWNGPERRRHRVHP